VELQVPTCVHSDVAESTHDSMRVKFCDSVSIRERMRVLIRPHAFNNLLTEGEVHG